MQTVADASIDLDLKLMEQRYLLMDLAEELDSLKGRQLKKRDVLQDSFKVYIDRVPHFIDI